MSKKQKHQKHAKLTRPAIGQFGRKEWAIIGTPCGNIQQLSYQLIEEMSNAYRMAYVDADHASGDEEKLADSPIENAMDAGAQVEYIDKIHFHRFDKREQMDVFQYREQFQGVDGVIVNGNHFLAKQQIVVVDPKKEASLKKKLDRLTDVRLFLLVEGVSTVPAYLQEAVEEWKEKPVLALTDTAGIAQLLLEDLKASVAPVKGLVLAGGKSQRMGSDKGLLTYHGKPQREHMAELLSSLTKEVALSCRPGQLEATTSDVHLLPDSFIGLGPFGAILSAFREDPNAAWLVVACDLPLLDEATLAYLIANRNPSKLATAFLNPATDFPDPLVTIWEPRAYPTLLSFLAQGYSCPRKVLINTDIELLEIPNPEALRNVNTPEELEAVQAILGVE
ncbi:MAG: NTP transferase domain-containing protein [Cyanothece sp. SIO1E1]|nr:NTP transferase domain-containing protein [Cyanothece sp. SIO1E1]